MPSVFDIYPSKWLRPDVIGNKAISVTIEKVTVEKLYNSTARKYEDKLVVKFVDKELRLICNKTQSLDLVKICGTDDYLKWGHHQVRLTTTRASNGKLTIVISHPSGQVSAPTSTLASAPQTEAQDDGLWEPNQPVDEDFYPDDHPAKAPDRLHGQSTSGARLETPENIKVHGQGGQSARPVNDGSGPCPACHAPIGKPHTTKCTAMQNDAGARLKTPEEVKVRGQEVTPEKVAARPGGSARPATSARTYEQEVFDFDEEVYAQMATLYDSNLPLSKELSEFMRKARNADHDSAMKMSASYLKAITTTLQSRLTVSEDEAYMMLTALVGYRIDADARPGQLLHGYLLKPLRDDSEVALACLKELSDVCLTIYSDMMDSTASPQAEGVANEQ